MEKIKTGDKVAIIAGRDKGKEGTVLRVLQAKRPKYGFHKKSEKWLDSWRKVRGSRLVVEGINMVTKHVKPNPHKGIEGGRIRKESTIHVSNVAVLNPKTGKADKVGIKILDDGTRVRYFKSDGELVDSK
ncbi:MAG: 50S ribosomal protein L24 [Gammaproteobacteria bacterium]